MKIAARAVLALILCALAVLLALPAFAAEPSRCSPPDGTRALLQAQIGFADHRPIVCGEYDCRRQWVDGNGFLRACQAWVPDGGDPEMREPPPKPADCSEERSVQRWEVDGARCDSDPRGSYTGTDHALPRTLSGYPRLITNFAPGARGQQVWACDRGAWVLRGQTCAWINDTTPPAPPARKPRPRAGDAKVGPAPKQR